MNPGTSIRAVAPEDWPAIWRFMRRIVAAGETFSWERDISEEEARARWCHEGANPRPPDLVPLSRDLNAGGQLGETVFLPGGLEQASRLAEALQEAGLLPARIALAQPAAVSNVKRP